MKLNQQQFKHIVVDHKNYMQLKELGKAGDSFNDVITEVLEKIVTARREEEEQEEKRSG